VIAVLGAGIALVVIGDGHGIAVLGGLLIGLLAGLGHRPSPARNVSPSRS
jgi:hypothetical protein